MGYPTTLQAALHKAQIKEVEVASSRKTSSNKSEEKKDPKPVTTAISYAGIKGNKKSKTAPNKDVSSKPKFSPGTKPNSMGLKVCSNKFHKQTDDRDHFSYHCPLSKANQTVQPANTSNPSEMSDKDLNRLADLELANSKYNNMMVFSYKSVRSNSCTILLDTGGTDHDVSSNDMKLNIRDNPDKNVPIKTIMGNYYCEKICTAPFVGKAGSSKQGKMNVWSLGKCLKNPNMKITCHPRMESVNIQMSLLKINTKFTFNSYDVLTGDGREYLERLNEYKTLCEQLGLDFEETCFQGDKLREKLALVAPTPVNTYESVKAVSASNQTSRQPNALATALTKKVVELAVYIRDVQHKTGSFASDKLYEAISNGSVILDKYVPLHIVKNVKKIQGPDSDDIVGMYSHKVIQSQRCRRRSTNEG